MGILLSTLVQDIRIFLYVYPYVPLPMGGGPPTGGSKGRARKEPEELTKRRKRKKETRNDPEFLERKRKMVAMTELGKVLEKVGSKLGKEEQNKGWTWRAFELDEGRKYEEMVWWLRKYKWTLEWRDGFCWASRGDKETVAIYRIGKVGGMWPYKYMAIEV